MAIISKQSYSLQHIPIGKLNADPPPPRHQVTETLRQRDVRAVNQWVCSKHKRDYIYVHATNDNIVPIVVFYLLINRR